MSNDWILDVLADLGAYARGHNLRMLAEQLDDAQHVAAAEIASFANGSGSSESKRGGPIAASDAGTARSAM